ncbi:MAG TPA: hypothetical protein VKU40_19160 [Thermoanaerobaculia bacterium]|nr:hypothetical protein [Thermoanaerobaculia bacterium]
MHWLTLLIAAGVLIAIAAVTGLKPKEGRPVSSTRLMTVARVVLVLLALILAIAAFTVR